MKDRIKIKEVAGESFSGFAGASLGGPPYAYLKCRFDWRLACWYVEARPAFSWHVANNWWGDKHLSYVIRSSAGAEANVIFAGIKMRRRTLKDMRNYLSYLRKKRDACDPEVQSLEADIYRFEKDLRVGMTQLNRQKKVILKEDLKDPWKFPSNF